MRNANFWIALGVGAAIGGAAAILYDSETGAATRNRLKRGLDHGLDDLGGTLAEVGDYLKQQAERLSVEAQRLIDSHKDQVNDALDAAQGVVKSVNKAAKPFTKYA